MANITLKATAERVLFEKEDTGYKIISLRPVNPEDIDGKGLKVSSYGNFTMQGTNIPDLTIGQEYDLTLKYLNNNKYPESYSLVKNNYIKPQTAEDQWKFLGSLITENQYINIRQNYSSDDKIIDIINDDKFDYTKIRGYGEETYDMLKNKVQDNTVIAESLSRLSDYGIDYKTVKRLYKVYGNHDKIIEVIEENPYKLINENGFGFIKADKIAMQVGIAMDAECRIQAGISQVFLDLDNNGDIWIQKKLLYNKLVKLLGVKGEVIKAIIADPPEEIFHMNGKYSLARNAKKEIKIALDLIDRSQAKNNILKQLGYDSEEFIKDFEKENEVSLSDEQKQFITSIDKSNVMFLIGNAGTGKSFVQKIVIDIVRKLNKNSEDRFLSTLLLAPTGRASRVLGNYTGQNAFTIHKVLIQKGTQDMTPLTQDIILVDEASMCDVQIVEKLLRFARKDAIIIFIGDDAQIPSVGVGNFLYDCINSDVAPVVRLTRVFRQNKSGALYSITKTREGKKFLREDNAKPQTIGKNFLFRHMIKEHIPKNVKESYKKMIANGYQDEEIGILMPTNIGEIGTIQMNRDMQEIANPYSNMKDEKEVGKKESARILRVGDYVMNTKNMYDIKVKDEERLTSVFNGETGRIMEINKDKKQILMDFSGDFIYMSFEEASSRIFHAWCVTIHKSQGSQYKSVIVVIDRSSVYQLNANLLYTGLSRASEYLAVYGQADIFNRSLKKFANYSRKTFLGYFLELLKDVDNVDVNGVMGDLSKEDLKQLKYLVDSI